MLSKGNGNAEITSQNLVKIIRGEVPYDRIRGVDISFTDRPAAEIQSDVETDVYETLEDYEPRVEVKSVELERTESGIYSINLDIEKVEEEEDEDGQFD